MTETRFVKGSAKKIQTQYWDLINLSINVEDFNSLPQEKGYVRLTIADRKSPDNYGNNMTIKLNDYVAATKKEEKEESLPF